MSDIAIATAKATRALRRFGKAGPKSSDGPTPERLLKARGLAHIEISVDSQGSAAMKVPRVRIAAAPLEEMATRRRLSPDAAAAAAMLSAGRRYHSLWHRIGLSPLKGQDPGKIRSTMMHAGLMVGPDDTAAAERYADAYRAYRAASDAMPAHTRRAVDAIVLHEMPLVEAGAKVDVMTKDRTSRITLATHEMKVGLRILAIHFGMMEPASELPDASEPVHHDMPAEMTALLATMDAREARPA